MTFTRTEAMVAAGARALAGRRVCFVGIGLPNIAVALAQRTVAPGIELIYESGVYGSRPARLPLSIGDPCLVTGSLAVMPMAELFQYYLQGGLVDVGFLGAAQIDRRGDLNTTVIGDDYHHPKVRLPGSGGACDIAQNAREVIVLMRQSRRSFVETVDFRTSPGSRVSRVITDLGVYTVGERLELAALHPGVSLEEIRAATGWDLDLAPDLAESPPPTPEELRILRSDLDPEGIYLR